MADKIKDQIRELLQETTQEYEILVNPLKRLSQQINDISKAQKDLIRSGGTFFSSYTNNANQFSTAINTVAQESLKLFGNASQGIEAFKSLSVEMKSFVSFSRDTQAQLAQTSMKMAALGFDTNSMAKIMDTAVLAFGKSGDELKNLALDLGGLSQKYMISPQKLASDFDLAQKNFAYTSDRFMDNFEKLQIMSRKTGIEFSTMTNAFGDKMDTFGGAAQTAGKLNAILGQSALNTLDLLGKTEAERAVTIRQALQSTISQSGGVDGMGKFQLKAIADTLGLGSIEDTRRFLRGEVTGAPGNQTMKGGSEDLNKRLDDNSKKLSDTFGKFDGKVASANGALGKFTEIIKNMRSPDEQFMIDTGASAEAAGTKILDSILTVTLKQLNASESDIGTAKAALDNLETNREKFMLIKRLGAGQFNVGQLNPQFGQTDAERFSLDRPFIQNQQQVGSPATSKVLTELSQIDLNDLDTAEKQSAALKKISAIAAGLGTSEKLQTIGLGPVESAQIGFTIGAKAGEKMAEAFLKAASTPSFGQKLLKALFE